MYLGMFSESFCTPSKEKILLEFLLCYSNMYLVYFETACPLKNAVIRPHYYNLLCSISPSCAYFILIL